MHYLLFISNILLPETSQIQVARTEYICIY